MQPTEMDITVNLFGYYRDMAVDKLPYIDDEYDTDAVVETIRNYSVLNEYCWFNAYEGQRPVGLIAGCITQPPWTNKRFIAHIDMVFLLESHRSLDNFRQLIKEFEAWARLHNCTQITAGDIGIDPDRLKVLYEHFGFKSALMMVKEIEQ
jgi:GNAT superfamily N-acetyltransferase